MVITYMKLNERLLNVSQAYVTIPDELEIGQDVVITLEGEVTSVRDESNHDGTYNRIYRVRGRLAYENKRGNTNQKI